MRIQDRFKKRLIFLLLAAMLATTSGLGLPLNTYPAQPQSNQAQRHLIFPLPLLALADFDGDRLPDLAELVSDGLQKNIHLMFGSHWRMIIPFSTDTPQSGRLHAGDIDHDNDNDLVWISNQPPVQTALWLNNGSGEFTRVIDPTAYTAEIEQLAMDEGSQSQLAKAEGKRILATIPGSSFWLKCTGHHLFEPWQIAALLLSHRTCRAKLASYLACHPKRGPPTNLS